MALLAPASELLTWLVSLPPSERDAALDARLGIAGDVDPVAPGEHLIGYHPSGIAPILRAFAEAPLTETDVLVDLGSGVGKVVLLAALLTGAGARGVEVQPALVERARAAAARLALDVRFDVGDARDAELADATVVFLYLPFTGPALQAVLARIRRRAAHRDIVICALGVDLDVGDARTWLVRRPLESFWLAIYDSAVPGAQPRRTLAPSPLSARAPLLDLLAKD